MMIDATKLYEEWGDKKKLAPGQWLNKKENKELANHYNFQWHKENKSYFFEEGLYAFYECYLDPSQWKKMIGTETEKEVVEVVKEVEKPFDATEYYKAVLKYEMETKSAEIIKAMRSLTKRDTKQMLDIFSVKSISELIEYMSLQFVRLTLSHAVIDNISVDKFLMSYTDVLLGLTKDKKHIYLTPGFRIKISDGTNVSYC